MASSAVIPQALSAASNPGKRSSLRCDIDLTAQGKSHGFVRLPHSVHRSAYGWIPIPIVRIANGPGPSVLLVAGNHGDEWEGQIALAKLIRALDAKDIRGRLVILPGANFPATQAGLRTSPIDDGNLNRLFPGDPGGSVSQQIAFWIEHVLLPGFDVSLDLHSGGSSLVYMPSTLAYRVPDAQWMARTVELIDAFGAPVANIVTSPPSGGRSFTAASLRQGVLSIATEIGGGGQISAASLATMESGIRAVLAHVGMLNAAPARGQATRLTAVGGDDHYVYANEGGLFEPLADIGQDVQVGQPAARIHRHDTPWREPELLLFQTPGLVLCKRVPTLCARGDCLFQLAGDTTMDI